MTVVKTIDVAVTASTDGMAAGLSRAQTLVKAFATNVGSIRSVAGMASSALAGLGAAALAAFGADSFTSLVSDAIDSLDELGKKAAVIGTTTDRLAALEHALGITTSFTRDQMAAALERMTRTLGEISSGAAPGAALALERLGLSAQELAQLDAADAFMAIARAMDSVSNASERAHLLTQIFGRGAQGLAPAFAAGSKELAALAEEARRLGIAFSETDVSQVGAAKDAIERVGAVLDAVKGRIAVELAPVIEAAAKAFLDWANSGEGLGATLKSLFEDLRPILGFVLDGIQLMAVQWKATKAAFLSGLQAVIEGLRLLNHAISSVLSLFGVEVSTDFLDALRDEISRTAREAREDFLDAIDAPLWSEQLSRAFSEARAAAQGAGAGFREMGREAAAAAEAASEAAEKMASRAKQIFEETRTPQEKYAQTLAELDALLQANAIDLDTYQRALARANEELRRAEESSGAFDHLRRAQEIFDQTRTPLERYQAAIAELNQLLQSGALDLETYNRAVQQAAEELQRAGANKEFEAAMRRAQEVFEDTRTPLEQYEAKLAELTELAQNGLIDFETFTRAVRKAGDQFASSARAPGRNLSADNAALARGSAAAFSAIVRAADPNEKLVSTARQQLEVQRRTEQHVRELARLLGQPVPVNL